VERSSAQYARYQRTPYQHWRTTPGFPEFEFRFINEASTRLAALITGEVQIAELPDDLKTQAERQGFKLIAGKVPTTQVFVAYYCCHIKDVKDPAAGWVFPNAKLADVRVRRALTKAINRDELNKTFFRGKGAPTYLTSFDPTRYGWNPDWEKRFAAEYGYDTEAAKRLLSDAGYGPDNPLTINMMYPSELRGGMGGEDVTDAIGNMWRSVGVRVDAVNVDPNGRKSLTDALKLGDHVVIGSTASDQWTGATSHGSSTPGALRGREAELPAADAIMGQIRTTVDEKKLDELWRNLGNVLYDNVRNAPLFTVPPDVAVNPKVVQDWVYPGSMTGFWTHVFDIKPAN
jgi:ABC-type transport system substrate-binding protein